MNYIYSPFYQFENPSKLFTFNKRIVSEKGFKDIAPVVYPVGVTKSCERSLVIFSNIFLIAPNYNY